MTPNIEPRLEETIFTLPHRTPKPQKTTALDLKKCAQGSPQPSQTMDSPGTLLLWVGIRNSAMTPNIEPRLDETSFTQPHWTQRPQKTTAPDPKKLAQGSLQPSQTMVAQVPSPLWLGIRHSAMTPNIEPRLEETSFTLPHGTQNPQKTTSPDPQKIGAGVSSDLSDYG